MAATRAAKNRSIRQSALRDQLSAKGLVQQVIEISNKLEDQHKTLESSQTQALRASADLKMKLVNKYLPDIKAIELTGEEGQPIDIDNKWTVNVVGN